MTTEVLVPSSFVETGDDGVTTTGYLQSTTTVQSWVALPRNAVILATKDQGAGSPLSSTAYIEGAFVVTAMTGATAQVIDFGFIDGLVGANATTESITLQLNDTNATTPYGISLRRRSATGNTNPAIYASAAVNTTYYYRLGFYSALSQYGTVIADIYSDSGRTTLVASVTEARLSNATYRYVALAQNVNAGSADSITGSVSNSTLYHSLTGLDLTLFTETDAGTDLTVYADCIVVDTMAANINSYVYKDGGVGGYAGNYILKGVVNVSALSGSSSAMGCLMLSNTVQGSNGTADLHAVIINYASVGNYRIKLREYSGAVYDSSYTTGAIPLSTPTWIKVYRNTAVGTYGTLYLETYSDPNYLVQVGSTVSLTLHENIDFQYLMALSSYNGASANTITGTVGGVTTSVGIFAAKGAFSWAGKSSPLSAQSLSAGIGAFSWAGVSSPLSSMVQSTKGAFSWVGVSVNLNTGGQVNTTAGAFSWAGNSSPISTSIVSTKGAFSWAGTTALIGATVTSLRTAELTYWDTTTSKEIPDTGLTNVLYMLYNPTTGLVFDHSDNTFKASSSCVTPRATMTERALLDSGGTNLTPGIYDILLPTTGLSGLYQEYLFYYGTTNHLDSNPVRFQDGIEYLGGLTSAENTTLNAVPAAVLAAATATPIAANMEQTNGQDLKGDGTAGDKFRSTLVA